MGLTLVTNNTAVEEEGFDHEKHASLFCQSIKYSIKSFIVAADDQMVTCHAMIRLSSEEFHENWGHTKSYQ